MLPASTADQLRSPLPVRVLNKCGALIDGAVIRGGRAESFMAAARRHCRLEDFGGEEFVEPLARLLESCHGEAQLNLVGKIALRSDVTRLLCNRLQLEHERRLEPDIAREQIREPLFITGLPRTGTTLLHSLLAADPQHRAPMTWEIMEPARGTEQARVRRAERNLSILQWLAPDFCRVHATGARLPQECVSLMSPSFLSDQFDTMYNVPSYRRWFLGSDLSPAYAFHRRFLQHLQRRAPRGRWILKAPAHMFALPTLLRFYPDAVFIQTHRAPLQAVASVSSLITILRRIFSDQVDARELGREALVYWSETLGRFLQQRDRLLGGRVCDIYYADLHRRPLEVVREIYDFFGWSLTGEVAAKMRAILQSQPRALRTFHRYGLEQFGFSPSDEERYFSEYSERFPRVAGQTTRQRQDALLSL